MKTKQIKELLKLNKQFINQKITVKKSRICKCGISRSVPDFENKWKCLDCGGTKPKSKKGKAIIEAEMLYREGKENLRRLVVLGMIVGVGLIIIGIVRSL